MDASAEYRLPRHPIRRFIRALATAALGGILTIVAVATYVLNQKQDLSVWHTQFLDREFTRNGSVKTFSQYLNLEKRLFTQLHKDVHSKIVDADRLPFNRYLTGSKSDPSMVSPNWNKTYELPQDKPAAVAVLLHGLSDSPYSLQAVGQFLHQKNMHVIGMRIPGHGTAPSGLVHTTWQDMAAAVALTMQHANTLAGNKPIVVVGYSNGAALALHYTLTSLSNSGLRIPDRMVLFSAEIEITPAAVLAKWQSRIGEFFGLHKLAWSSVQPEYDPYKYNSFAINAANLSHAITIENQRLINQLAASGELHAVPPILAFQSVVDATVSAPAVSTGLFDRLTEGAHELVLFDVNRRAAQSGLFKKLPTAQDIFPDRAANHTVHVVTNTRPDASTVELRTMTAGQSHISIRPLGLKWPNNVYSLAHIALPFAPDDPVYGRTESGTHLVQLGGLALHGEEHVLSVPPGSMLRQHWNPFLSFTLDHLAEFIDKETKRNP
jgi:alpha-beta hydrolase superfamily lysophospholipase